MFKINDEALEKIAGGVYLNKWAVFYYRHIKQFQVIPDENEIFQLDVGLRAYEVLDRNGNPVPLLDSSPDPCFRAKTCIIMTYKDIRDNLRQRFN